MCLGIRLSYQLVDSSLEPAVKIPLGEIKKSSLFSTERDEPRLNTEGSEEEDEVGEEHINCVSDSNSPKHKTWTRSGRPIEKVHVFLV